MKIIIAPDSFKGCMRSPAVCEAIKKGILSVAPDSEIVCVPMADGGEGTLEAAVCASKGRIEKVMVEGPLGDPVEAEYAILGNSETAIMEMASASGLELIDRSRLNPMKASTYGTGQLINAILDKGIRDIVIGIGGSATVDGGCGMAQALGYGLLGEDGKAIERGGCGMAKLKKITADHADPRLAETSFRVACDVTNPLLGPTGAARVYGPQKGAAPEMVEVLEAGLSNFSDILISSGLAESTDEPGDGAAGGLGAGLRIFCGARIESGAAMMIKISGLEEHLEHADLLITGEGCTDSQTSSGKLCAVIAETAKNLGVPVMLFSGALKGEITSLHDMFDAAFSVCTGPMTLDEAMDSTEKNLFLTGQNIAGIMSMKK